MERSTSKKLLIVLLTALLGVFLIGIAADAHFPGKACENETPLAKNKHCAEGHGGENPDQCSDGKDNDGDGLVDGDDPDCQQPPPPETPECSDGIDNDRDGLIDLEDPDCTDENDDSEAGPRPKPACSDGEDNDGDGLVDLDDPGCEGPRDNDETDDGEPPPPPPPACSDGEDNDGDGLVDGDDPGCESPDDDDETDPVTEPSCGDPDGDGVDHSSFDPAADESGLVSSIVHEVDQALPSPIGGDQGVVTEINCALVAGALGL